MQPKIKIITNSEQAKILASETRVKILQEIAQKPKSLSQLARTLGITPVAVFYHIKKLEKAKFVKLAKTEVVNNNLIEKFYEVATSDYLVAISMNFPFKGPVPPKKQETKQILDVSSTDIHRTFTRLGLKCPVENQEQIERSVLRLLELAVHEAAEVNREFLNQLNLKLPPSDRLKIEYATMAAIPITLDRMMAKQESLETLRSVIKMLEKNPAP